MLEIKQLRFTTMRNSNVGELVLAGLVSDIYGDVIGTGDLCLIGPSTKHAFRMGMETTPSFQRTAVTVDSSAFFRVRSLASTSSMAHVAFLL